MKWLKMLKVYSINMFHAVLHAEDPAQDWETAIFLASFLDEWMTESGCIEIVPVQTH